MMSRRFTRSLVPAFLLLPLLARPLFGAVPEEFPRFAVPGHEQDLAAVRELFWLHYPGAGPKSTLWDEWLSLSSLWVGSEPGLREKLRHEWSQALSSRIMDAEGYVATHQHASIAHQLGWPFPFYNQGQGGFGWHFSFKDTVGPPWRTDKLSQTNGFTAAGLESAGLADDGWKWRVLDRDAALTSPRQRIDSFNAPFVQLRWSATGLPSANPCLEWTTESEPEFGADRRMYFDPVEGAAVRYTMVPVHRHPRWTNTITQLRLRLGNPGPGGELTVQALFSNYDTRHNINSQNYIRGCANYFWWTGDLRFLRQEINRMRVALRHLMTEHHGRERKVILTTWVGHDGRPGWTRQPDGKKIIHSGHGIGNNYWDLLPFGNLDCYATIHYFDVLNLFARLEEEIRSHPEWQVPRGVQAFTPEELRAHAAEVQAEGNRLFWNAGTGRFVACVDADGTPHDYGLTFLNLEAVAYGFATPEHARAILDWVGGARQVSGDTSQGADIYHWRFAPRATTRRNIDWYFWAWESPESIPFGGQVQDGGAVLGFSYHDLQARLRILGPDNAWNRLREIAAWFREVQAEGGYRKYYAGQRDGTLQGGGTAGGLGLDQEFFESVLVPQIMLYGFLGLQPSGDGLRIDPKLPSNWPELSIDRISFQGKLLKIKATAQAIEITNQGEEPSDLSVLVPAASAPRKLKLAPGATGSVSL